MDSKEQIYQRMLDTYIENSGNRPRENSDIAIRLKLLSGELFNILTNIEWLKKQAFPSTAAGKYLTMLAMEKGLTRKPSVKATGAVTFSSTTEVTDTITIPKNTPVCTQGTAPLIFYTTQEETVTKYSPTVTVPIIAAEGGSQYNVNIKAIQTLGTSLGAIDKVDNFYGISGGVDEETDEVLRARLISEYKNINTGCNVAYYKALALTVDQVKSVGVIPQNRGVGTVDIYIGGDDEICSAQTVAKVSEVINNGKEINTDVKVYSADFSDMRIDLKLIIYDGYDFDQVCSNCRKVLTDYIKSIGVGGTFLLAKAGQALYSVEGVNSYYFNTDYSDDTQFSADMLPTVGLITFTQGKINGYI